MLSNCNSNKKHSSNRRSIEVAIGSRKQLKNKIMKTLKLSLIHTFTGVANEKEMGITFLVIAIPVFTLVYIFFNHTSLY